MGLSETLNGVVGGEESLRVIEESFQKHLEVGDE